jgi:putative metallohydrolase (TIGR04338 family)
VKDTARVYAAEDTLMFLLEHPGTAQFQGSALTLPVERRFGDLDGVRRYLRELRTRTWGHAEVPSPTVRLRKGHTRAHWESDGTIALPDGIGAKGWAMREVVVLHEYAHHVAWHRHGVTGHGLAFQQIYLDLLEHAVGPEARFVVQVGLAAG